MKKIIFSSLLLFIVCNGFSQTAPAHLKYFGFYLVNTGVDDPYDGVNKTDYTDEIKGFTNLNQTLASSPSQNISADVNSMNAACAKPFLACEQIFWQRVGNGAAGKSGNDYDLYPDWQARWNTFKTTNAASLTPEKIGCFYINDEPIWNNITDAELKSVADLVKNDFPNIPVFYVEAFNQVANMVIPASVDWVGFDQYFIFDPNNNTQYKAYLNTLKSKRSNNQKIFIIGDTHWIPAYKNEAGVNESDMAATIQSYYDLAASEPDVIGLIGYEWPAFIISDGQGAKGAKDLPQNVIDKLKSLGKMITANYSPCAASADKEPPTVPANVTVSATAQTSCTLTWSASTDNASGVAGYEIYKDGVYLGGTTSLSYTITGLTCGTGYNFTVNAFDAATPANISAFTAPKSVTTSACTSNTPTVPAGLSASAVTQTTFTLSWTASTANIPVTGYDIIKSGVYYGGASTTTKNITGLTCGTSYSMTVDAFSNPAPPHNISAPSTPLVVTTSPCNATNLLVNPGFENPLTTGWTSDWNNSSLTTTVKNGGTYALKVGPGAGGRAQVLTSGFTVGSTYTVSAYCMLSGTGGPAGTVIGVVCKNAAGTRMGTYVTDNITNTGSFIKASKTFTVPASTTSMEVHVWYPGVTVGTTSIYVDDFALVAGTVAGANVVRLPIASEGGISTIDKISIYPNPVDAKAITLSVPANTGKKDIYLYDMSGRLLLNQQLTNANIQVIKLNKNFLPGNYVVKIMGAGIKYQQTIMVK